MNKRPHIIILNPDEMRFDTMGHMGNRAAHTPNLDNLAVHEAVSFDHAYCQNPVCVPSRCSFLTGLYPHTTGHRTMQYLMHENEPSLFSELKDAGYYVWLNGRNDFLAGNVNDIEARHANEVFYYDKNSKPDHTMMQKLGAMNKPIRDASGQKEYSHFTGIAPADTTAEAKDICDTKAAIDRIKRIDELGDKPLCLFVGWTNPHCPYAVEQKYYDLIKAEEMVKPISPWDEVEKSRMIHKLREFANLDNWTDEQWMELRRIYLAQCAFIDDQAGQIINALKEAGIFDDSAIFFFSDHGDFAGDYHLPEKAQSSFEDVLTRVPFLIKPPKMTDENGCMMYPVDPGLSSSPVELVDFYATAMKYAGVEPSHDHYGRFLQPQIADRSASVREYAHCEGGRNAYESQCDEWHSSGPEGPGPADDYYGKKMAQYDDLAHEKATMVTDGKWKFVYRSSGACEIYHLENDPYELYNLYAADRDDSEVNAVYNKLSAELLRWYQTTCDLVPKKLDTRFSEEFIWGTVRNILPPDMENAFREYLRTEHPDFPVAIRRAIGMVYKG